MRENISDWMAGMILWSWVAVLVSGVVSLFYLAAGWWGISIFIALCAAVWAIWRIGPRIPPYLSGAPRKETK